MAKSNSYFQEALEDFQDGRIDNDLWAECLAKCDFDKNKAAGLYLREIEPRYEAYAREMERERLEAEIERKRRLFEVPIIENDTQESNSQDKENETKKYLELSGINQELWPGYAKFVYKYITPITGAALYFFVTLATYIDINNFLTGAAIGITATSGWFLFTGIRAFLVPSFRDEKGFDEKHDEPNQYLLGLMSASGLIGGLVALLPGMLG